MLEARSTLLDCGEQDWAESPVFYGLLGTEPWQLHLCGFIFMTSQHRDGEGKDGPVFQMFYLEMSPGKVTTMNLKEGGGLGNASPGSG